MGMDVKGREGQGRREHGEPRGKPRLLDLLRAEIRRLHYSARTEKAYLGWVKRFILFHDKRHPLEMGKPEITAFLTHLAVRDNVSASTQNQALSAILFLYRRVLGADMGWVDGYERPKRAERYPVVLTPSEVRTLLSHLNGTSRLMGALMYGSGLRRIECCRLRVKDRDLERREMSSATPKDERIVRPFSPPGWSDP